MYAFMVNGGFMLFLAGAGFFGALVQVRVPISKVSELLRHVLSDCLRLPPLSVPENHPAVPLLRYGSALQHSLLALHLRPVP